MFKERFSDELIFKLSSVKLMASVQVYIWTKRKKKKKEAPSGMTFLETIHKVQLLEGSKRESSGGN